MTIPTATVSSNDNEAAPRLSAPTLLRHHRNVNATDIASVAIATGLDPTKPESLAIAPT